jgi:hypothetical protein
MLVLLLRTVMFWWEASECIQAWLWFLRFIGLNTMKLVVDQAAE